MIFSQTNIPIKVKYTFVFLLTFIAGTVYAGGNKELGITLYLHNGSVIKGVISTKKTTLDNIPDGIKVKQEGNSKYVKFTPEQVNRFVIEPTSQFPDNQWASMQCFPPYSIKNKIKRFFMRKLVENNSVDIYEYGHHWGNMKSEALIFYRFIHFKEDGDRVYSLSWGENSELDERNPGYTAFLRNYFNDKEKGKGRLAEVREDPSLYIQLYDRWMKSNTK